MGAMGDTAAMDRTAVMDMGAIEGIADIAIIHTHRIPAMDTIENIINISSLERRWLQPFHPTPV